MLINFVGMLETFSHLLKRNKSLGTSYAYAKPNQNNNCQELPIRLPYDHMTIWGIISLCRKSNNRLPLMEITATPFYEIQH